MRAVLLRGLSTGAAIGVAALAMMMISTAIRRGRDDSDDAHTLLGAALVLGGALVAGIGYEAMQGRDSNRTPEQAVADELSDLPRITLPWGAIPAGVH